MKSLFLIPALLGVATATLGATTTGNLLINPGAEEATLGGWYPGGGVLGSPAVDNGSFDSGIKPHSGHFDFVGYTGASVFLWQEIDLTDPSIVAQGITTDLIDAGQVSYTFSFWEQGSNQGNPSDQAGVQIQIFDNYNDWLNKNDPTYWVDSHNGSWQQFTKTAPLPPTARIIYYQISFQRYHGTRLDAFVDDNSFTLSTESLGANPVPEPSVAGLLGFALIGLLIAYRRRQFA